MERRWGRPSRRTGALGGACSDEKAESIGTSMEKALRVYGEVLRLVRLLPEDSRPYYAKYVRENFVNYREVDPGDAKGIEELFHRAYNHSLWVLNKYSVEESAANRLRTICFSD